MAQPQQKAQRSSAQQQQQQQQQQVRPPSADSKGKENADEEHQIKPIKLGKNPELEFHAFMLLLSCIKDVDLSPPDFVKGVAGLTQRGYIAQVFQRIKMLSVQWNYKIEDATSIMAKGLAKSDFKQFLEKLTQALSAGVRLREFNRVQSTRYMIQFDGTYGRIIDRLKQISEMFSALVSSISFMAVSMLIASMTVGLGNPDTVLVASGVAVVVTVFTMLFLIKTFTPKERVLVKSEYMPFGLHRLHLFNRPLLIVCAGIGVGLPVLLLATAAFGSNLTIAIGVPMAVSGVPLVFVGRRAKKKVEYITKSEEQYSAFIKNFGEAYAVTASTKESIRVLTHGDYGALEERIYAMLARLEGGMSSETAWKFFAEECGSYLIQYHTEALRDALGMGASAAAASGEIFTSFNAAHSRRMKRDQVAGFLKAMITPLQLAFAGVLVFIQAIVKIFGVIANQAPQYITLLRPINPELVSYYSLAIIGSCLIGSALGISIVEGNSEFDLTYSLGLHLVLTGIIVALTAFGASLMLAQFANLHFGTVSL